MKMKAKFIPVEEYEALHSEIKESTGVFSKDDDLERFLESRQADGAFATVIYFYEYVYDR